MLFRSSEHPSERDSRLAPVTSLERIEEAEARIDALVAEITRFVPDDPAADAPHVEVDPDTGPDQRRRIGDRLRPEVVEDLVGSGAVREDPDHRDRCRRGPG